MYIKYFLQYLIRNNFPNTHARCKSQLLQRSIYFRKDNNDDADNEECQDYTCNHYACNGATGQVTVGRWSHDDGITRRGVRHSFPVLLARHDLGVARLQRITSLDIKLQGSMITYVFGTINVYVDGD